MMKKETVLERFLRYVVIDTQSKEDSETYPSTAGQWDLLNLLVAELKDLGAAGVRVDKNGYVTATVPGTIPPGDKAYGKVPPIGFLAHVDTSPDVCGANVKPQIIHYQGGDIVLPGDKSIILRAAENPHLADNLGLTIVTSDGTTLLGADNKAGVAILMSVVQALLSDPAIPHGDIRIAFTPDEEVGAGTKLFNVGAFGAKFAYTVDGDAAGELNMETFSADTAVVTVRGRDIHPGRAKGIMVNSVKVISELIARLPGELAPENTEGYEPYIHPNRVEGGVGKSVVKILFRDFKTAGLDLLKQRVEKVVDEVKQLYPEATIELEIMESYRNMREGLEKDPRVVDYLWEAAELSGLKPKWVPIRGGTDGAKLTEAGLPTPNIFTGGSNFHSRSEWVSVHGMEKSIETVVNLCRIWAEKA